MKTKDEIIEDEVEAINKVFRINGLSDITIKHYITFLGMTNVLLSDKKTFKEQVKDIKE